jgi:RimJ/RimL family protein N-acetyltransferase
MTEQTSVCLSGYGVELAPVREKDLEQLRAWRNDPAISQYMLSQATITTQQQQDWFRHISNNQYQQHFVIHYRDIAIGAANIKEQGQQPIIKSGKALKIEPGIYLGEEKFRNNVMAFAPSLVLLDYCFEQLGVASLYATVHENNQAALNYNEKLGYRQVSNSDGWVSIELAPDDYEQATTAIKKFLKNRIERK